MSLRLFVLALILLTAAGLGLVAYQVAMPPKVEVRTEVLQPNVPPPPKTGKFMVAARAIPAGTLVRDEDFRPADLALDSVPEGALQDTPDNRVQIRGALVRAYMEAKQVASMDVLLRPRDRGFLAAVLAPGTRAVTIPVDAISGVAGLLWPGDRVDLMLVEQHQGTGLFAEIIMSDLRVIAVDQHIVQGAGASDGSPGLPARVVTFQVTEEEAQRIAVASRMGQIRLVIRAAEPPPVAVTTEPTVIFSRDVSPTLANATTVVGNRVRVIQGESVGEVTFK